MSHLGTGRVGNRQRLYFDGQLVRSRDIAVVVGMGMENSGKIKQ